MRLSHAYFMLAAAGLVLPWWFNIAYLASGGSFAPGPFFAAVAANALTAGITWDVYIAAVAASLWMLADSHQRGTRAAWVFVVLCFAVGLAFAYPLYLGRRELLARRLDRVRERELAALGKQDHGRHVR
jgi:hypothetical protein